MTRIIAGTAGGRRIRTPKGPATRPTTDRVREALFSRLESAMALGGSTVLDLYAGSGALGLEAASRGAAHVLCVESHRAAARLIEGSAGDLGLLQVQVRSERVERVLTERVQRVLTDGVERVLDEGVLERGPQDTPYDLVLADPPYPVTESELAGVLALLDEGGWVAPGGLVVLERSARSPEPTWPQAWRPLRSRRYGETMLHMAERPSAPDGRIAP